MGVGDLSDGFRDVIWRDACAVLRGRFKIRDNRTHDEIQGIVSRMQRLVNRVEFR